MEVRHLRCETGNKVPARRSLASGLGTTCGTLGCVWVPSGLALPSSTGFSHRMHFLSFVDGFENFCQGPETVGAAQLCAGRDGQRPQCAETVLCPAGTCHKALQVAFSSLALDVVGITSAILVDHCLLNVLSGSWQVGEACG